jgi:hypothetical protein
LTTDHGALIWLHDTSVAVAAALRADIRALGIPMR